MKDPRIINILITSIGSFGFGPSLIKMLQHSFPNAKLFGVDITKKNAALHMVDIPLVSPPYGKEHITFLIDACKKHKIDILLPLSADDELLPLVEKESKDHELENNGTILVGKDFPLESLRDCVEKDRTYAALQKHALHMAEYYTPTNIAAFDDAVNTLGYPEKKVLIKPITGAGNRGLRILDAHFDVFHDTITGKPDATMTSTEEYRRILEKGKEFPGILVMEYLTGKEYSVYCLCDKGKALYVIPQWRVATTAGMSLIAQVDMNEDVITYSKQVIEKLQLHGVVDLQLKFNDAGKPVLYEINPRYSASVVLSYAAGVDLPAFGILQALGEPVPKVQPENGVRMIRFADEVFVSGEKTFRIERTR